VAVISTGRRQRYWA